MATTFKFIDEAQPTTYQFIDEPTSEYRGDTSGRSIKQMQRDFVLSQGGLKDRVKQRIRDAVPYIRPTVEGLGAAGGAIVGAAGGAAAGLGVGSLPGGVAGGVIGSGLGFGIVSSAMDTLEGTHIHQYVAPERTLSGLITGEDKPTFANGLLNASIGAADKFKTGAMFEMGGQTAGKLITNGIEAAPGIIRAVRNPVKTIAENRAARTFDLARALSEREAANLAKSQALAARLRIKLTPAQMTRNPEQASIEQALSANDPTFAAKLNLQDATAKQAALDAIGKTTGPVRPLPITQDMATTGEQLTGRLDSTSRAERAINDKIWAKVPTYEMPHENLTVIKKELSAATIPKTAKAAVQEIIDFADNTPKTVQGMQAIERTIGRASRAAAVKGEAEIAHWLDQFKGPIKADFDAIGKAADAGDIALHNGKIVYPSQIRAEITGLDQQIQGASEQAAPLSEQNKHLFEYLAGKGEVVLQNTGISDAQYAKSLADRLGYLQKKGIGAEYTPPTVAGNLQVIDNLQGGIAAKQTILDNLQPADNVAETYGAAKKASANWFNNYGKGAVKKVLQRGDEINGSRIVDEKAAQQFFTPSQSKQLIKAIGPEAARTDMRPFVLDDLSQTAAKDGVNFNVQSGITYIQKHKTELKNLGLLDDAQNLVNSQVPGEMERTLVKGAADPATGQQFYTAQQMRNNLAKYSNTVSPETVGAFKDYKELMAGIDTKTLIPRGGLSNTTEKSLNAALHGITAGSGPRVGLMDNVLLAAGAGAGAGGGAGFLSGHGLGTAGIGALLGGTAQLGRNANKQISQEFVRLVQDGVLNPETAKTLASKIKQTGRVPDFLQSIIKSHVPTGATAGLLSGGN